MTQVFRSLDEYCRRQGIRTPSRASLYRLVETLEGHRYRISELPKRVQRILYNLDPAGEIPGHQLAFYCLNYGGTACISFAAGLPWLDLYQAARMRGWRTRSRGLLDAVLRARRITSRRITSRR
jgi:hypothetical protein